MKDTLLNRIQQEYPWLIEYVKSIDELDFQTGNNPISGKSWFSIYRGTGRILTIDSLKGKLKAANAYKRLMPKSFFECPNANDFNIYLNKIRKDKRFSRYYEIDKKNEGYYQNLISRRYTFCNNEKDDFIIIDKECVLGFNSENEKKEWVQEIILEQNNLVNKFRSSSFKLPKDIKAQYGEIDFLGLNWNGDIIIMELKQNAPQKTYLSPIQVGYYHRQFSKLLKEDDGTLYDNICKMINQKIEFGLIKLPKGKTLPKRLSGKLKSYVIVGDDIFSNEVIRRYQAAKSVFLPDMEAYSCMNDGTLKHSILDNII